MMSKQFTPLGELLYHFHTMVDRATGHLVGGVSRIPDMKAHSWNNLGWFSKASDLEQERLKNFFIRLDTSKRVEPNSERRNILLQGVTQIVRTICVKMEELEPRFKGQLIPMGSSHNNTKIGDADEFDFSYALNMTTLLKGRGSFKKLERDDNRINLCVELDGMSDDLDFYQFPKDQHLEEFMSINGSKSVDYFRCAIGTEGGNCVLNTEHVAFAFYLRLQEVLSDLKLPSGWCHGGFNRPNFSGIRFSLPSFMLQFVYEGTSDQSSICLSVDFVPVIQMEKERFGDHIDILNDYLWEQNYAQRFWCRLERSYFKTAFYSHAEERLLAEYSAESVAKVAIRLSKALHSLANLKSPKYPPRFLVEKAVDFIKQRESGESNTEAFNMRLLKLVSISENLSHLLPDNDFVTFDDLGENLGHFEYVTSYMFKRTVMTMLALDETHGHDWTLDDLPDLVISIFMIINDILICVNQSMTIPVNEVYSEDGSTLTFDLAPRSDVLSAKGLYGHMDPPVLVGEFHVPLQEMSVGPCSTETTSCKSKDKVSSETSPTKVNENASRSSVAKPGLPRFYTMIRSAITKQECDWLIMLFLRPNVSLPIKDIGLDVGIAQVFQLLQCVCEGRETAKISIYRSALDEDDQELYDNINKYLVTKEEFKSMLDK